MDRRRFLVSCAGGALPLSLAGCSDSATERPDSPRSDTRRRTSRDRSTPAATDRPQPVVSWSERRLRRGKLDVSLDVELDGAGGIEVIEISPGADQPRTPLTTVRENGRHRIAGPETAYGPVSPGTILHADVAGTTRKVSEHMVGSSTTPRPGADHLDGLSGSTLPDTSVTGSHERTFTQTVRGRVTEFSLSVPTALYEYYAGRPRIPDYGAYVSDDFDDRSIERLARTIEDFGETHDQSARAVVDHAIAWVQGMEYTQDQAATGYNEYPKYPFETLVDRGGDCEDTCILLASVLRAMDYGVVLLVLPDAEHMAVGVAGEDSIDGAYYAHEGTNYYYLETTGSGWQVGDVPPDVQDSGAHAEIRDVNASPSLALEWESSVTSADGLHVDVTVSNWGDAPATGARAQIAVETPDGQVVARDSRSLPEVTDGNGVETTLDCAPPAEQPLRLRVGAIAGRTLHDVDVTDVRPP